MMAALTTVAWWFGQFPYIVRRTPHPELGPTCEFRLCHAFTMIFYIYYYLRFAPFFVHRKMIWVGQYHQLGVLTYHATSARRGASTTYHYPMPGTSASLCRPALTVLCHHFGVPSPFLRHLGTDLGDGTLSRIKLRPRHQYRTH